MLSLATFMELLLQSKKTAARSVVVAGKSSPIYMLVRPHAHAGLRRMFYLRALPQWIT